MPELTRARLTEGEVARCIRDRVISGIHGGHLAPGDRLPSYREVAEETGLDLRAIARIYRGLEADGLVEVRRRSGVFVAEQTHIGGGVLPETASWIVAVLREAWTRRVPVQRFGAFVERCTVTRTLHCACIESTEDQLRALTSELREYCGLETAAVHADRLVPIQQHARVRERVPEDVRDADLLVTTSFHAPVLRPLAETLGTPLIAVHLNRDLVLRIERALAEGELTAVVVDPRFLERLRLVVGRENAHRIRGVLAHDRDALSKLDPNEPILISHAAQSELDGLDLPPSVAGGPALAPDSVEEIVAEIVLLNLRSE